MSGRFSLYHVPAAWQDEMPELAELFVPRWNVAPRRQVLLLCAGECRRQAVMALWGFTPRWSRDMSHVATHARVEGLVGQEFFAGALARQRGVLPANGFFEWRGKPGTVKQPYWLSRRDELLYMAALWEPYKVPGYEYLSVAMLTRQAAYLRRPVLLAEHQLSAWLDPDTPPERITELLQVPPLSLQERKVATQVNDPDVDGPECIRPL